MAYVGSKATSGNPGRLDPGSVLPSALPGAGRPRPVHLRQRDAQKGISVATAGPSRKLFLHLLHVPYYKSLVTTRPWWISGLEMTMVAVIAGAITYGLGVAFAIN